MTDDEIDLSDIPATPPGWFDTAVVRNHGAPLPATVEFRLEIEPAVLLWFAGRGREYPLEMAAALRAYMEAHEAEAAPVSAAGT
ncbi:MAG: hypothetical protein ACKVVT_06500 [Dehalococcoidia bacterium]